MIDLGATSFGRELQQLCIDLKNRQSVKPTSDFHSPYVRKLNFDSVCISPFNDVGGAGSSIFFDEEFLPELYENMGPIMYEDR